MLQRYEYKGLELPHSPNPENTLLSHIFLFHVLTPNRHTRLFSIDSNQLVNSEASHPLLLHIPISHGLVARLSQPLAVQTRS